MNHLNEYRIEISQKLKQLELNKEINSLRIKEKEIEEALENFEEPKKIINKILTYFNNVFNKMFSRYSKHINEDK